jgi:glycosyl transferase-like sugar-binding protein
VSLSVCSLTDAPGARVQAIFSPLREIADEIVIAADRRVGEEDMDGYRAVADRVLRREVEFFEPNLAWLHEQCAGDWILRLDGDEVPSCELVERLPELTAATDVRQYWLAWRWLDPTGTGWLDELPWFPAFHNRLVRNDRNLAFVGRAHTGADPSLPARFLETPVYHLQCALRSRQERVEHSYLSYELREPGRTAPGGGPFNATYYLPERFARRPPAPVPEADRPAISAALGRPHERRPEPPPAPALAGGPFRVLGQELRLHAGERRSLFVEVTNKTGESWPGGLELEPRVRLSYHWRDGDGDLLVYEGERSPLPASLRAGEAALAPVTVVAPDEPGHYLLELDLVHELVRWFGSGATFGVTVVPAAATERNVPARPSRLRRQRIPRVIHRIWLGPRPMPAEHVEFGETWREHHPRWEHRLWTNEDLPALGVPEEAVERARDASELSNVVRYHLLTRHGGVYVDTDFECLRAIDPLLGGLEAFAAFESPGAVACGLIGCVPDHAALRCAAELSLRALGVGTQVRRTGPNLLTHVLWDFPEVTLFPPELFYPYDWTELHRRHERFDDAYAVHHWAMSWSNA